MGGVMNHDHIENHGDMPKAEMLARAAYAAYGEVTGYKNYQGLPMPTFNELSETIQRAWTAAAGKVAEIEVAIPWRDALDSRQLKEIEFAQYYAANFAHGTTGHNQLMIIAKLVDLLDGRP
jgi:hypothetical protein